MPSNIAAARERLNNLRQTRHLALTPTEQEDVWVYIDLIMADHARLTALLTPPDDAEVREAVEHAAKQLDWYCQHLNDTDSKAAYRLRAAFPSIFTEADDE